MRWLIIFVTAFVLMFSGGGITKAEDNIPMNLFSIFDGMMTELQAEKKTYKGDVTNHTFYRVDYAIMPLIAHQVSDAVIVGWLAPGETRDIELEAGEYMFVAFMTQDGEMKAQFHRKFRIAEGGADNYGFDIRDATPRVKL